MFLTNGEIILKKPGQILDHGVMVPDYDNLDELPLGRFSIQPAGSVEDNIRAVAEDSEFVAYGDPEKVVEDQDEVILKMDDGSVLGPMQVNGRPRRWVAPAGLLLSHTVIQLKYREEDNA